MKKIPLRNRQGKLLAYTLVDEKDFKRVIKFPWHLTASGYAATNVGKKNKKTILLLHRLVKKPGIGKVTDHINRNRLDNRRKNLREATPSENAFNRKASKTNKLKLRGVSKHCKICSLFFARIKKDGRVFHLGFYKTPQSASRAHKKAAQRLFGKFVPR